MAPNNKPSIAIVTTILDDWGGSEELWAKSIPFLRELGVEHITIYRDRINFNHPKFKELANAGVVPKELNPDRHISIKIFNKLVDLSKKLTKRNSSEQPMGRSELKLLQYLKTSRPSLVIISQAINFDGLHLAYQCYRLQIPYVIIMQKAVDFYWPDPLSRGFMKETLLGAEQCFFVSQHNKTLTEEQFGIRLRKSRIVFNPVKTGDAGIIPYPDISKGFRLACIGRLFIIDKGQDILLRILAQDKWRDRDVHVSFIGTGPDTEGIKEMAELLGIPNVSFKGYADDMANVWAEHHALILPSRSEGLPLVITEAMAAGRTIIATNAGGNAEVIEHGITGFIGEANEKDFGEAMEQAWAQRSDWETTGIKAAESIKKHIPVLPEQHFAGLIKEIINAL